MSNFVLRTLSGIALVVVLIGGILWCDISRVIILSFIGLATLREMFSLFSKSGVKVYSDGWLSTAAAAAILIVSYYLGYFLWVVVVLYLTIRFSIELYRRSAKPIESIGYELFAMCYIIVPIVLLLGMSVNSILFIFVMVWINDVGAYLIGSRLGRRRLFERISPKKSWEGFWGGVVLVAIAAGVYGYYEFNSPFEYVVIGVIISVAAVFGDLFESMFKRSVGVKDSGNTIPGHGGFWDRFDALFFAVPAYYVADKIVTIVFYFD